MAQIFICFRGLNEIGTFAPSAMEQAAWTRSRQDLVLDAKTAHQDSTLYNAIFGSSREPLPEFQAAAGAKETVNACECQQVGNLVKVGTIGNRDC